jgi:hypothetical protein
MCCLQRRLWSIFTLWGNRGVRHDTIRRPLEPETEPVHAAYIVHAVRYEPCVLGGIRRLVDR